ncbi:MAG: GxxExxY protein [Pirellulaceae bacterium]
MTEIVHKELSYAVTGCIFDVHNAVGPGVREESYQKGLEVRLGEAELGFLAKPYTRRELIFLGEVADVFEPDLLIEDKLVVELKAQKEGLTVANFRQVMNYLKFWNVRLGLLVNFAAHQAVVQRVLYQDQLVEPDEDYDFVRSVITPELRPLLKAIRDCILSVHRCFGLGYNDTTYRQLISIALRHHGCRCESEQVVSPVYHGRELPRSPITPLFVEGNVLIEVEAVHDNINARAVRTMQTHLEMTKAALGLVVNFGKDRFQIRGVRPLKR